MTSLSVHSGWLVLFGRGSNIVNPAGHEGFPDLSMSNHEDSTLLDLLKVLVAILIYWSHSVIVGEIANFVAYAFAPTVLVTSWRIEHYREIILKEKLHLIGVLGCIMCIAGSIIIVIHAPKEQPIKSDLEIWSMATQPAGEHDFFPG
ncbi:hypothetical protein S245_005773 [Arachis hypogaea]